MHYDTHPDYSSTGVSAMAQHEARCYEADKNDIIVRNGNVTTTLQQWTEPKRLLYGVPIQRRYISMQSVDGTIQWFEVDYPGFTKMPTVSRLQKTISDVAALVGQSGNMMIVTRTDMNRTRKSIP